MCLTASVMRGSMHDASYQFDGLFQNMRLLDAVLCPTSSVSRRCLVTSATSCSLVRRDSSSSVALPETLAVSTASLIEALGLPLFALFMLIEVVLLLARTPGEPEADTAVPPTLLLLSLR